MYNEIKGLSERAEALDKKLEGMIQGIQEAREELARIWGFKLEEPVKEKEVAELLGYRLGGARFFGIYREAPYCNQLIEVGFPSIDEALQWATDNGYTVEGY
jgi:hypothetical protein